MRVDEFDPQRVVEVLNRHQVEYVLVGGYAAQLYGARRPTYDIDITPSTTLENLHRLSAALRELGAGIRVDDLAEGLPFDCSAESLRGTQILNLRTRRATSTSRSCRRVSRKDTTAFWTLLRRTRSAVSRSRLPRSMT